LKNNMSNLTQPYLYPIGAISNQPTPKVVNVASVPQRSIFRYPGGKTWFVPIFRSWVKSKARRFQLLLEPFAGGGVVGLTAVFENLTDKVLLVELDENVSAVWETVLSSNADWLIKKITNFDLTRDNLIRELNKNYVDKKEIAFQTILKNRTYHGGILADGSGAVKYGENGRGLLSRWYPRTLANRIKSIQLIAHKVDFICGDGLKIIAGNLSNKNALFFIDPPYTAGGKRAGKRLYRYFDIDHDKLFKLCSKIKGDFIMTYDNAEEVKMLASKYRFDIKPVVMKNTHHTQMTELVIGKDLTWI
jgi:DNA adenine methylase